MFTKARYSFNLYFKFVKNLNHAGTQARCSTAAGCSFFAIAENKLSISCLTTINYILPQYLLLIPYLKYYKDVSVDM